MINEKVNDEKIEEKVTEIGYTLLNIYRENHAIYVVVQDLYGYKYDVSLSSLCKTRNPEFVGNHNPFSFENIHLWIKLNEKPFSFSVKNTSYKEQKGKVFLDCLICEEIFYSDFRNIRHQGSGCTYCSGQKAGRFNNLEYLRPDLAKEWNYKKNTLFPSEVVCKSNKRFWWICSSCSHEWKATPSARVRGTTCPACAGKVATENNSLASLYPEIASEWHPSKNGWLTPHDVTYSSGEKVYWLCYLCSHTWEAKVYSRIAGNGCPFCKASRGEKKIISFANRYSVEFIHRHKFDDCRNKKPLPFDIYLPDYNLLIEYHGEHHYFPVDFAGRGKKWAKEEFEIRKKLDKIKADYCRDNNIPLKIIPYWDFDNIEQILTETLQLA